MIAVGFFAKTGSAVAVAVAADPRPRLVDRAVLDLAPGVERFVYHAAQALGRDAARSVRDSTRRIERAARAGVEEFLRDKDVGSAAIVGHTLDMPASLEVILGSHSLVHTAEGVLYRAALADALAARGVAPVLVAPDEVARHGWVLEALGKVPSPWRKEHKDATLAAASLLALTPGPRGARARAPRTARATRTRPPA